MQGSKLNQNNYVSENTENSVSDLSFRKTQKMLKIFN